MTHMNAAKVNATTPPPIGPRRSAQGGVVLIIALIVLLRVTSLGVPTLRTTTMQEKMAGNSRDRDRALQAAEAAVQTCLAQLSGGTFTGTVLNPVAVGASSPWDVPANWTNDAVSKEVAVSADAGLVS